eukprot:TRINITY_DN1509_c0_g1_i1.p1 TRINITY_DN1509_c0_g1~~TRINITY_DN1509_c0_g1_i1.p1  ORF type:complete len:447 (+),score=127.67 TRINITY_DN1509_c0_g1_i1:1016-2356(+)
MTEHEPSLRDQAEVAGVSGSLDLVLTLKKPRAVANASVFSNARELLVVLPEWLVRRTRPGWDYWLQRIGVSEQELLLFADADLGRLLTERTGRPIDRHAAIALRRSFQAARTDESTHVAAIFRALQGDQPVVQGYAEMFGNVLRVPLEEIPLAAGQPLHLLVDSVLAVDHRHPIPVPMGWVRRTRHGSLVLAAEETAPLLDLCRYVIFRTDDPLTPEDVVLLSPHNRRYWDLHEGAGGHTYRRDDVPAALASVYRLRSTRAARLREFGKRYGRWEGGAQWLLDKLGWHAAAPLVQQRWRRLARGLRENQSQAAAEEWAGATDPYLPPPQQAMDPMGKGPAEYFGGKYLDEDSLPPEPDPGGPQWRLSDGGGVGLLASNQRPAADDDDDDDDIEEPSESSDHAVKGFPSNKRSGKWPISTPAPATIPIRTRPTVNRTLVPSTPPSPT